MKRNRFMFLSCLILVTFVFSRQAIAQDHSSQILYIIYIDHEVATPVNTLCSHLQRLYNSCDETGNALIIYLSDGEESLVSLTNLDDPSKKERNKPEAFDNIISALQNNNFHRVNVQYDRSMILQLFDEFHVTNDQNELQYKSVTFDFYIGPEYWQSRYNEKIIAPLYLALGVADMPLNRFSFNIFRPHGTKLEYSEGQTFGITNLGDINKKISIQEFRAN